MALPLLARLSASARAAYPFIKRGVTEGRSLLDIQILLQERLAPVAAPELLRVINGIRRELRMGADLRSLAKDRIIGERRLHTALTKLRRQYSFDVLVRGWNPTLKMFQDQFVTVSSSRLMTPYEIESQAVKTVMDQSNYGITQEFFAEIQAGRKAGDEGTL